jgi:hypothetical protein
MPSHLAPRKPKPSVIPTVAEIRALQAKHKLTNAECAALVCAKKRSWENWVADPSLTNHRPMPAMAWKLFRSEVDALPPRSERG